MTALNSLLPPFSSAPRLKTSVQLPPPPLSYSYLWPLTEQVDSFLPASLRLMLAAGINAVVEVDGKPLEEYTVESTEDDRTITCWIA